MEKKKKRTLDSLEGLQSQTKIHSLGIPRGAKLLRQEDSGFRSRPEKKYIKGLNNSVKSNQAVHLVFAYMCVLENPSLQPPHPIKLKSLAEQVGVGAAVIANAIANPLLGLGLSHAYGKGAVEHGLRIARASIEVRTAAAIDGFRVFIRPVLQTVATCDSSRQQQRNKSKKSVARRERR